MASYSLYTDGAYSPSRQQGGIGLVILRDQDIVSVYSRSYKNTTNIKMELVAVMHGIKSIKKPISSLDIYTDSMYVIGCATLNYKRKANLEYWKLFDELYDKLKTLCPIIRWHHVYGHTRNKWNEYCDDLYFIFLNN